MIVVEHTVCGKPAFHATKPLIAGALDYIKYIVLLDGTRPLMGSPMICGSCLRRFTTVELRQRP